jgi:hypothetical protein
VLRGRHFAVLAVLKKRKENPKTTLGPIGGMETPQTPFFRLYFFAPLCSFVPLGVLFSAGGPSSSASLALVAPRGRRICCLLLGPRPAHCHGALGCSSPCALA